MKIRIVLSLVLALFVAVLAVGCSAPQQNAVTTTPNSTQSGTAAADPTATPPQNTASSNEPFAPTVNTTDPTAAPQNTPAAGSTGNITDAQALEIALSDAGLTEADLTSQWVEPDRDDGREVYEVNFMDGTYEYEYKIAAADGTIWERDFEITRQAINSLTGTPVDRDGALAIALARISGATAENGYVEQDRDDGRDCFEGTIYYNNVEYEFEIDAATGAITSWNEEYRY